MSDLFYFLIYYFRSLELLEESCLWSALKHLVRKHGWYKSVQSKSDVMCCAVVWHVVVCVCVCVAELEVARLSTDGNLADLTFPQSEQHGNSIQLSASTLKQHGKNGTRQIPHLLVSSRSLWGLWPLRVSFYSVQLVCRVFLNLSAFCFCCCSMSTIAIIISLCLPPGEIRMAFVLYRNLDLYLPTENASVRLSSEAVYPNYSVIVNSPVITASINRESNKVYLSEPVVFTVKHLQVRDRLCHVCSWHFAFISKLEKLWQSLYRQRCIFLIFSCCFFWLSHMPFFTVVCVGNIAN